VIDSGALGHLVTVNRDGSPQVAIVWVGIDGDELVTAHLSGAQQKLRNVTRDSRVVVSFEAPTTNAVGMHDYLVVHGRARITEGGAPELLQQLARCTSAWHDFRQCDPPRSFIMRITPGASIIRGSHEFSSYSATNRRESELIGRHATCNHDDAEFQPVPAAHPSSVPRPSRESQAQ
jgi:PPOX class probable F420-dependent enzyme